MREDKYIWEEFKNGEEHALSYIYYQNIDFLAFFGRRFTKDENLVIDCIQDLFYELIRKKRNLGETDNIRLYLLKSLRRKLVREIQKKKKHEMQISELEIFPNIGHAGTNIRCSPEQIDHLPPVKMAGLRRSKLTTL